MNNINHNIKKSVTINTQNDYNGILCVIKPEGFTSFDVIAKMRGILKFRKIGHGGTLDPMATGVLPLFLGKATKAIDFVQCHDKEYNAKIKFGVTTDTLDRTGTVLCRKPPQFTRDDLIKALEHFKGEITQLPPMYSAVQVGGRRLYDIARSGESVERTPRKVTVHKLDLLEFDEKTCVAEVTIGCSKGTYIRAIADDLGQNLGCGAMLEYLQRGNAMGFGTKDCYTIEQIQAFVDSGIIREKIIPVWKLFLDNPKITLTQVQTEMYRNGVKLDTRRMVVPLHEVDENIAVYSEKDVFLGISTINEDEAELTIKRLFDQR